MRVSPATVAAAIEVGLDAEDRSLLVDPFRGRGTHTADDLSETRVFFVRGVGLP